MITQYPSIYAIGHRAINDIFSTPVLVEEKIDGSQFSFKYLGPSDDNPTCIARSKGQILDLSNNGENCNNLFKPAVKTMLELAAKGLLKPGYTYRGEAVCKPKHNTLEYGRIPTGGVIIFDIDDGLENYMSRDEKEAHVLSLGLEVVPWLAKGKVNDFEDIKSFLDRESYLGGCKIEGFVVKNYNLFGRDKKIKLGKFVSEAFKEKHNKNWKEGHRNKEGILDELAGTYCHEGRWLKAVQHLKDDGKLQGTPSDIGPLMKEITLDILKEEKEEIKDKLFEWAWKKIASGSCKGFAQWYKEYLAKGAFDTPF